MAKSKSVTPIKDPFDRETHDPTTLLLDARNPRLFGTPAWESKNQDVLLKMMWSFGVIEIIESIAATGYQAVEPLFAERVGDKLVVIEGNRRLTALQLLLEPERAKKLGIQGLPPLRPELKKTCLNVPIAIGKREQVWTFIATKHLNGPKMWDSLAKAAYVKYVHEEIGETLDSIARSIGDRNSTVSRMYESLKILEQAEKWKVYDRDDHTHKTGELPFSHLYTLIGYDSTRKYLGLGDKTTMQPVDAHNKEKLGEVLTWVFGSTKNQIPAIIKSQNPDLRYLAKALQEKKGVAALRAGYSPSVAAEIAEGDEAIVLRYLSKARDELQNAQRKFSTGYKKGGKEIVSTLEEIREVVKGLSAQKAAIDSEDI